MKNHPPPTGDPFRNFLATLAPHLTRLASSVPVYFKLIDYVPRSLPSLRDIRTLTQKHHPVQFYIKTTVTGTGVAIWDSTLKLSLPILKSVLESVGSRHASMSGTALTMDT
ncbi:uncharacterized protein LOC119571799 [Penaeus monodon]|uniref:uncharacterized protein LOC119571799 n=1 Tax=Penaeus monodon TaxID=6687 RepID=UPI0018A7B14B|nr:uncharacterized protein LOC119571799 [Penaeus monodon]